MSTIPHQRTVTALVVASSLMLIAAAGAAGDASVTNGLIAFSSDRGPVNLKTSKLFVIRADGTGRALWSKDDDMSDQSPVWSPNGKRIVFTRKEGNPDIADPPALVLRESTGEERALTPASLAVLGAPAWSADGRRIVFFGAADSWVESGLFVVNADGSALRKIVGAGPGALPSWSPRADRIAFTSGNRILLVNADGSGRRQLSSGPRTHQDQVPLWSPDGTRVLFRRSHRKVAELYSLRAQGGTQRRLTRALATLSGHRWSPDGRRILYVAAARGQRRRDLFVMASDGSRPRRIARRVGAAAWSPDGRRIVYTSGNRLLVIRVDGKNRRPLVSGPHARFTSAPSWSSRSILVSVLETRNDAEIYTVQPSGGLPRQLTRNAQDDRAPSWSRDGRRIAYAHAMAKRGQDVWVMDADGKNQRRLFRGSSPSWSPDGRRIVYEKDRAVFISGLQGGNPRRLAVGGRPDWSPDGRWIAFLRESDVSSILVVWDVQRSRIRSTSDLTCESGGDPPLGFDTILGRPRWRPDSAGVTLVHDCDAGRAIYINPLTVGLDGNQRGERLVGGWPGFLAFSWAPDGSSFASTAGDGNGNRGIATAYADGSNLRLLTSSAWRYWDREPDWGPAPR